MFNLIEFKKYIWRMAVCEAYSIDDIMLHGYRCFPNKTISEAESEMIILCTCAMAESTRKTKKPKPFRTPEQILSLWFKGNELLKLLEYLKTFELEPIPTINDAKKDIIELLKKNGGSMREDTLSTKVIAEPHIIDEATKQLRKERKVVFRKMEVNHKTLICLTKNSKE